MSLWLTFRDMGDYYGFVINPTKTYSPQDKALVEGAVKLVYQRIYYELSKIIFLVVHHSNISGDNLKITDVLNRKGIFILKIVSGELTASHRIINL